MKSSFNLFYFFKRCFTLKDLKKHDDGLFLHLIGKNENFKLLKLNQRVLRARAEYASNPRANFLNFILFISYTTRNLGLNLVCACAYLSFNPMYRLKV